MKYLSTLPIFLFALASCDKECDKGALSAQCQEEPPTNELCQAYFTTWFYDESTNSCYQQSYSGCDAYGFATEQECSACECN